MFKNIAVAFIILITTWVSSNLHWSDKHYTSAIQRNDATCYYAYMPAILIYKDLSFSYHDSVIPKYYIPQEYYYYKISYKGKIVNKGYAGTAFAIFPFFIAGHLYAKATGYTTDGFSKPYYIAVNIASIIYLLIGLIFTSKLLTSYGASDKIAAGVLLVLAFATNLFYYAACEPCLTHVYSFTFISAFVYNAKRFFHSFNKTNFLIAAFCLGFITFIRPVNAIIVLSLPFIAANRNTFTAGLKWLADNKISLLISALLVVSIAGIQLIIYKIQCGDFFVYSYPNEGFTNWNNPQIINFFFSYRKGFFLYTPIAFLSLFGIITLWRKNKYEFFTLLFFFSCLIYMLTSWWSWSYGGSFSSRVMLDFYIFLALMLLFAYRFFENKIRTGIILSVCTLLIIVCQIQVYQYRYFAIEHDEMTKEKYWDVFLRIDKLVEK